MSINKRLIRGSCCQGDTGETDMGCNFKEDESGDLSRPKNWKEMELECDGLSQNTNHT